MGKVMNAYTHTVKTKKNSKKRKHRRKPDDQTRHVTHSDENNEPPAKIAKKSSDVAQSKNNDETNYQRVNERIQEETVYVDEGGCCNAQLKIKSEEPYDLFLDDELRDSYISYNRDFYFHIIDEIALEGLDGITLEAFWKRLSCSFQKTFYRNADVEHTIWKLLCKIEGLQFYELSEPRKPLDIYNRYKYVDQETGQMVEVALDDADIYPCKVITNNSVQGSCSTFDTRLDVTDEVRKLSYEDVCQRYGSKLVIVADQAVRTAALYCDSTDPMLELVPNEYCILERIARARHLGELTQGSSSISSAFKLDSKSIFHYLIRLVKNGLVTKQLLYLKSMIDDNKSGGLLTLTRFYRKVKSKQMVITDKVANLLRTTPGHKIPRSMLQQLLNCDFSALHRTLISPEFKRFITTHTFLYRDLYPDSKPWEYLMKNEKEREVKVLELIDPNVNIIACWQNDTEDLDNEEDDETKPMEQSGVKFFNMEIVREVYYHILRSGETGVSISDLWSVINVNRNTIRQCLRRLVDKGVVETYKVDDGRLRRLMHRATCRTYNEVMDEPEIKEEVLENRNMSSIKARMIEKQRAAVQQKDRSEIFTAEDSTGANWFSIEQIINIDHTSIPGCLYFIKRNTLKRNHNIPEEITLTNRFVKECLIKLSYVDTNSEILINMWLNEIQPSLQDFKEKFADICDNIHGRFKADNVTKVILLKLLFEEIKARERCLMIEKRKRKISTDESVVEKKEHVEKSDEKLQFMGSNPIVVFREIEDGLELTIEMSTPPEEYRYEAVYPKDPTLTDKVLSRLQIILDIVNQQRVVADMYKLQKHIEEIETSMGSTRKIDRKSLLRLLTKLVSEGHIRIYRLTARSETTLKSMVCICHLSVLSTDYAIENPLQQIKFRCSMGGLRKQVPARVQEKPRHTVCSDVVKSIAELRHLSKHAKVKLKSNQRLARVYGYKPKMIRIRVLHEFMFYLIYDLKGSKEPLGNDEVKELFANYGINLSATMMETLPPVYCRELSWRMFIPPLPEHPGWPQGWSLVADLILSMPVSVLLKLHSCTAESQELMDLLNHPIKRHYLVKQIPESARQAVLFKGRYIRNIHECLSRMAFCGLSQFGPIKIKEKEQTFVYLNRTAYLLDTVSSERGYNKVSKKEYPRIYFVFNSQADVENYWVHLHGISMNTNLNSRVPGQLVTYTDLSANPSLMKALAYKTPEEAVQADTGVIPGDNRGAAGLDSSLWCHIMRNWVWASSKHPKVNSQNFGLKKETMEKLDHTLHFDELTERSHKVFLYKKTVHHASVSKESQKTKRSVPSKTSQKFQKITRELKHPTKKINKRAYYDQKDKAIMKKIGAKVRVKWSPIEDKCLLLCKLGDGLFSMHKLDRKVTVGYIAYREVMHKVCPVSANKTSRAIERRVHLLMRNSHNFEENLSRLLELPAIQKYFVPFMERLADPDERRKIKDKHILNAYVLLMGYIFQHRDQIEMRMRGDLCNSDYLHPDNLDYVEKNLVESSSTTTIYKEPENEHSLQKELVRCVVLSSLTSVTNSSLLFKVYERFSDGLIRETLHEMRRSGAISKRRSDQRDQLAVWQAPFKISNRFLYMQTTVFDVTTANEAYKALQMIKTNDENRVFDFSAEFLNARKHGRMLAVNEFLTFWDKVHFKFNIPQSTVILNPDIQDHSEVIEELALRFQHKTKKVLQERLDADQEDETEGDSFIMDDPDQNKTDTEPSSQSTANAKEEGDATETTLDVDVDQTTETIDRLKSWVTDCMEERRSPSPEFMITEHTKQSEEKPTEEEKLSNKETSESKTREKVDRSSKLDYVPSIEEIKEEMLRPTSPDKERRIPYITEMLDLLTRDSFPEMKTPDETLEKLKNHFVTQYTVLENLTVEGTDELETCPALKRIEDEVNHVNVLERIRRSLTVLSDIFAIPSVSDIESSKEGNELMVRIVKFVAGKNKCGATGPEITKQILGEDNSEEKRSSLIGALTKLVDAGILFRAGICNVTFVHFKYREYWLIDILPKYKAEQTDGNREDVRENEEQVVYVKMMPWVHVDGTLNEEVLIQWLCTVLATCLNFPRIPFYNLCGKFMYIKPTDIYFLLEILQDLGCVELYTLEPAEGGIFSDWEPPKEGYTTILDDLRYISVEAANTAMLAFASFVHTVSVRC